MEVGRATFEVTCSANATGVSVRVYGTDGLEVLSPEYPVRDATWARGSSYTLAVDFEPGNDHSNIAILVEGEFRGRTMARTTSFTVGEPLPAATSAGVTVDDQGRIIHTLPASPAKKR